MELKNLVCVNTGDGTRINVVNGKETAVDITVVSEAIAGVCWCQVNKDSTLGSNH